MGVRYTLRLVVDRPSNEVGPTSLPHGRGVWLNDWWDPDIPSGNVDGCGEDRGGGKEKGGKSGREFHRNGVGVREEEVGCESRDRKKIVIWKY